MVDDSFVPSSKQPSVVYCRLMDFIAQSLTVDFKRYFQVTLVHRIEVQDQIYLQVGKFLKNIKSAGQNRHPEIIGCKDFEFYFTKAFTACWVCYVCHDTPNIVQYLANEAGIYTQGGK